jgi:hypothetical protein
MKYGEISATMRAFIGNREGFRKMGFKAEDLYCSIAMSARHRTLSCFVKLQLTTKSSDFNMEVGPVKDGQAFEAEYKRVSQAINAGEVPQADMDRMWQECEIYNDKMGFTAALLARGFRPPNSLS